MVYSDKRLHIGESFHFLKRKRGLCLEVFSEILLF